MATCKTCGKKFHACSSCSLDYHWQYNYYCEECFTKSDFYKEIENSKAVVKRYLKENPELLDAFVKLRQSTDSHDNEWVEDIYYSLEE